MFKWFGFLGWVLNFDNYDNYMVGQMNTSWVLTLGKKCLSVAFLVDLFIHIFLDPLLQIPVKSLQVDIPEL